MSQCHFSGEFETLFRLFYTAVYCSSSKEYSPFLLSPCSSYLCARPNKMWTIHYIFFQRFWRNKKLNLKVPSPSDWSKIPPKNCCVCGFLRFVGTWERWCWWNITQVTGSKLLKIFLSPLSWVEPGMAARKGSLLPLISWGRVGAGDL